MSGSPKYKVYNPQGEYIASCKHLEDAACLAGMYGSGASIREGHAAKDVIWREGQEEFSASDSYDGAAKIMLDRMEAKYAAMVRRHNALAFGTGKSDAGRWYGIGHADGQNGDPNDPPTTKGLRCRNAYLEGYQDGQQLREAATA